MNGKVVLPYRAVAAGLKGHLVPAVYAILDSNYKRGSGEGWERVVHVGITRDLASELSRLSEERDDGVANVRALSFSYPQKAVMEDFAEGWRVRAREAGGLGEAVAEAEATALAEGTGTVVTVVGDDYEFDDDDDDDMDEDDMDDYLQMMAESRGAVSSPPAPAAPLFVDNTGLTTGILSLADKSGGGGDDNDAAKDGDDEIVSPFDSAVSAASAAAASVGGEEGEEGQPLDLTPENVDRVLDEVRPYLISDGGNVSVQRVDSDTGDVHLLLEGACGSCASSTVTMQMGIERVLREKFGERLGEVLQAEPEEEEGEGKPKELTMGVVQAEVDRISTAIVAMGGVVRVVGVDPIGVVEIDFRGPNRVRKGLELALLDVEFVKHVKFVSS